MDLTTPMVIRGEDAEDDVTGFFAIYPGYRDLECRIREYLDRGGRLFLPPLPPVPPVRPLR